MKTNMTIMILSDKKAVMVSIEKPKAECPLGIPPLNGVPVRETLFNIITMADMRTSIIKVICHGECFNFNIPSDRLIILAVLKKRR